jgi:hypothetical protein
MPEKQSQPPRAAAEYGAWSVVKEFVGEGISQAIGREKRPAFDRC